MKQKTIIFMFFFIPLLAVSQKITVTGIVKSSDEVLMGVNIIEKNTTNGTTTDIDGNYSIKVDKDAVLVFTYLGFKAQEIAVKGKTTIDVSLKEDTSAFRIEDVVVQGFSGVSGRARRRVESVQEIPESVIAFDATSIETKGISNIQSFSDQIPNVNFTNSQSIGNNFITVRGISHIRNGESPIAFVVDGVTLPDPNLINQELFDLALIEVVKGPQGAFYGRNAIAGAINIVTNEPTNSFSNKISLGYGNGNLKKLQLSSTGPLLKDKLFYRISGSYKKGDGLLDNITLNKAPDFIEDLSIRGQLKTRLSSNFNATLTGQFINAEAGATYYATALEGANFSPDDFDNQAIQADQLGNTTLKGIYANLKLNFNFEEMTLTHSTTYNKGERSHFGDLDFKSGDVLRQIQDSNTKTFNQEIRLSSKGERIFTWDLGVFYQNTDKLLYTEATADFGFILFTPPAPTGIQTTFATSNFTNNFSTIAAYIFADYKLSDRFNISAGLRYDNDNISQDNVTLGKKPSKTVSQLQPKLSLSLNVLEKSLLYANYGRGYRSGGFNQDKTVRFDDEYDAEITDNFELGLKNSFWEDRLIVNLSGYYIDFLNQQLYALVIDAANGNILIGNFNVPESESYGFELDFKIRPSKYLDVLASYGLSKSKIIKGTSTFSIPPYDEIDISGKNTPLIPQSSFLLGLESNFDLTEKVSFNGNINLKGTGKIYWHEDNARSSRAYNLLNARFGFSFSNISANLWGTNILNKSYLTEYVEQKFSGSGTGDAVWQGQPVAFGIDFLYKF
ncbi:MAG: TonB-dependent receptor [Tenacibaculum sp.]